MENKLVTDSHLGRGAQHIAEKIIRIGRQPEKAGRGSDFSPADGAVMDLASVPDPVFSQKMMGDGIAVEPANGDIVSPVEGEVIQLFHTKHAVGIRTLSGAELLIHVGLDTVNMNGEGFEAHVKEGDKVKTGDLLLTCRLDLIKEKQAAPSSLW